MVWRIEASALAYGLTMEWGNSAHLLRDGLGIASIHDTALENELTVSPGFDRGRELFVELAQALVGIVPEGPVQWLRVPEYELGGGRVTVPADPASRETDLETGSSAPPS